MAGVAGVAGAGFGPGGQRLVAGRGGPGGPMGRGMPVPAWAAQQNFQQNMHQLGQPEQPGLGQGMRGGSRSRGGGIVASGPARKAPDLNGKGSGGQGGGGFGGGFGSSFGSGDGSSGASGRGGPGGFSHSRSGKQKTVPCLHFNSPSGRCPFGDSCSFLHIKVNDARGRRGR